MASLKTWNDCDIAELEVISVLVCMRSHSCGVLTSGHIEVAQGAR